MTIWTPSLEGRTGARYEAIAEAIAEAIETGDLAAGDRLPPQRDLAWRLGVTTGTVGRAYALVRDRGYLSGEVGRGTFVRAATDRTPATPFHDRLPIRSIEEAGEDLVPYDTRGLVDLARNAPSYEVHADAMREALAKIVARPGLERLMAYMPTRGHRHHREAGALWVKRIGLDTTADRVTVCGGSQQAIAATLSGLAKPGDMVLAETYPYPGLTDAAEVLGRTLKGVSIDDDGIVPDALDRMCRETPDARMLFMVPTLQNPTATIMSEGRRRDIVDVARKHDLLIVEDDVYGYLPEERPIPIAAIAPERTIYMTSTSKCLAPGLRVAWIVAPKSLDAALTNALHNLTVCGPPLTAEVARTWILDGTADKLIVWQRREVAARQAMVDEILGDLDFRSHPAGFHVLLQLPHPWRADEFAGAARAKGIAIVPGSAFALEPGTMSDSVRISLSAVPDRAVLAEALRTIRDLVDTNPATRALI